MVYMSDAGTPGISDPARDCRCRGGDRLLRVLPCPAPAALPPPLSVAGVAQGGTGMVSVFAGFLPTRSAERKAAVDMLRNETRCTVLLKRPPHC